MPDYRGDFFDFGQTTFLNCAYHGPLPRLTAQRMQRAIENESDPTRLKPDEFFSLRERNRARLSELLNARMDEIALVASATQGIGIVASGMQFSPGDEVIISSDNFPSNLFTWLHLRRLGVRVHVLKSADGLLRVEDVAAVMNSRTRILALDWVSYSTGVRKDLAAFGELAHRHGAIFVVDATQGAGAMELDLRALPVDVLIAAAYKWLLAPYGTGFAYLNEKILDRLDLKAVSWLSVEGSEDFDALPAEDFTVLNSARKYDILAFINMHGLEASLEYLQRVGVRTVTEHCTRLLDRLAEGLRRRGHRLSAAADPEYSSTILCFQAQTPQATASLNSNLKSRDIVVSLRHGMIRVSPHLYNNEADIDKLLACLDGQVLP